MRVTVFLPHGGELPPGFGALLAPAELDPPTVVGVVGDVVGPSAGAVVPDALGFGDVLSLADAEGESVPPSLADVLGDGAGGAIDPIPGLGETAALALVQLRDAVGPGNGIPPTGELLLIVALPAPPPTPPPAPGFPPGDCAELEVLGKIACWASRATYAPTATMETDTPSAASGRTHLMVLAARPPPVLVVGPKRSQASWATLTTRCHADWNPPGARRKMSVHTASTQATASGRGRPSRP